MRTFEPRAQEEAMVEALMWVCGERVVLAAMRVSGREMVDLGGRRTVGWILCGWEKGEEV